MNVAAYVRVSSTEQANDKHYSIPEQTERVENYCKARGWNLIKIYTDPGYTGANLDRPALQDLINDIKAYDIVLVNKLDRLSRSQIDILHLIQDIFLPNKCSFVSMQESFDTSTPIGMAMVGILAAFAELERSQIRERMVMGKQGRKKKGLWHGGSNPPIGYDFIDGKLVINSDSTQVQQIYDMYLNGMGIRDITRYMSSHYTNKYSSWDCIVTVRNILKNPVYVGMIGEYKGQHQAIINKETFDKVQNRLDEHKLGNKVPTATHLLTGMIFCGHCGKRVTIASHTNKKTGKRYSYYRCGSIDSGQISAVDKKCELKSKKESTIDDIVIGEILKLNINDIEIVDKNVDKVDNSKEIKKLDKQISRLIDLYAISGDDIEGIATKLKELNKKKKSLQIEHNKPKSPSKKQILHALSISHDILLNGDNKEKRKIIDALISKVVLYNDRVEIKWKFF